MADPMKDNETIVSDDKTEIEDKSTTEGNPNTITNDLDERILASKIQTVEELLKLISDRQVTIMESLANIQSKLAIDIHTDPVVSEYEALLKSYLVV